MTKKENFIVSTKEKILSLNIVGGIPSEIDKQINNILREVYSEGHKKGFYEGKLDANRALNSINNLLHENL
jgi:hypothetical protein